MLYTSVQYRAAHMSPSSISKYTALFGVGLRVADPLIVVCAGAFAYWLRFGHLDIGLVYERALARALVFSLLVFSASPLYRSWRGRSLASELGTMLATYTALWVFAAVYITALKLSGDLSRLWRAYWFAIAVSGGMGVRLLVRGAAAWTRTRGIDLRRAVIVGTAQSARRVVESLDRHPWAGIQPVAWFGLDAGEIDAAHREAASRGANGGDIPTDHWTPVPCLGRIDDLADYVESRHINQVWVALPFGAEDEISCVLMALAHSTADIKFVPDVFGVQLLNHSVEQVAGLPVLNLRASPLDGHAHLVKALEDRVLATLILLLIAPLLAVIALGVKLSSPGPVLFRQKRHGLDGKVIEVWKFRSMRVHAEGEGKVTQATRHDPRVTRFGRFLRRTSLDELPQFFNVLQGTMSVVGPRPHAVAHNHQYMDVVFDYMQRHRVKPGITGWAQVNGFRGETDTIDKMRDRVEYDLHYMQNWSLWLDLRIVASTVFNGFAGRNAY